MTTEKWQLYSQTGVDGPEYGVRIRTGYTVVGFQKEDAQAIVAWQNASIQPEGDIMEKAKALRNAALPRQTYSIPGQTGYGNPSLSKGWDFSAVDELVRVVVLELIAEVEAKRNLALDMLTKNKDLLDRAMRAEAEVERLRNLPRADVAAYDRRIQEMAARIKELEEMIRQLGSLAFMGDMPLDQIVAHFIAWGQSNYDYTSRLEAAFLGATKEIVYATHEGRDAPEGEDVYAEKVAREAQERIKAGGKDEA